MSEDGIHIRSRPKPRGGGPEHEVLIVGASVAGCRTALTLAEQGVRVLLLDKAHFPRWKPCAGGLTLKTRPYLSDSLFQLVECAIHGAYLRFGDQYVTHIRSQNPMGWMVHRESFDEAHLQLARAQPTVGVWEGVTVRDVVEHASGVEVDTTLGNVAASVLVGADGATSVVSRALPGHDERPMGFAYEGEVGHEPDMGPKRPASREETLFDFRTFPHGYGWIFPKRDHHSVGSFVCGEKLPGIKELYREFLSESEWLQGVETYRTKGHPTSLGGSMRRLSTRRVVLVGEAASLVDPLTGEGIYYALRSGYLAGVAIGRFLKGGEPVQSYGDQVRDEIQNELRYARMLAELVYNHPRLSFHFLLRNTLLCQWLVEVGVGLKSYKALFREAITKGFLLPFHAGFSRELEVRVEVPTAPATPQIPPGSFCE